MVLIGGSGERGDQLRPAAHQLLTVSSFYKSSLHLHDSTSRNRLPLVPVIRAVVLGAPRPIVAVGGPLAPWVRRKVARMKVEKIKEELQKVKAGNVRHFGFIKGKGDNDSALAITPKAIAGTILTELQEESGNKIKPIVGQLRYDLTETMFIFETRVSPATLTTPLRDAVRTMKLPIPRLEVRELKGQEGTEDTDIETPDTDGVAPISTVGFMQARILWDAARKSAHADIEKVKAAVAIKCRTDSDFAEIKEALPVLDDVLTHLDDSLCTLLDAALNAPDAKKRGEQYREAQKTLQRYRTFLTSDPLVLAIDQNGFISVKVQENLLKTVTLLESKLK
jgi:hypothetical protein